MIPEAKQVTADKPWLLPAVIQWLDGVLLRHWTVLETGCGGSTVYFARIVRHVISYEHDPVWHAEVMKRLDGWKHASVDLLLRPTYATEGLWPPPMSIAEGGLFDLAFIDGRGRVRSVLDALPALRPGGWLVLDDAGRDRYAEARRVMDNACSERIEFRSPPWQPEQWTTAWRKR